MTTTPPAAVPWRHRLADRLVGGELLALRAARIKDQRLLEELQVANDEERQRRREVLARLRQTLALDATRERQMRAVVLLGALLHRFQRDPAREVLVATASQTQLDRWAAIHDDLSRPRPADDVLVVADREPTQPAVVHPPVERVATSCGEWVRDCSDLDCGGCGCHISPPCTHCMEHSCTKPKLHDGDHKYDPESADA